jgi:hypothetical protein
MVVWVLFCWEFYQVVVVKIWSGVTFSLHTCRRIIHAVVDNLFGLSLIVHQLLGIQTRVLVGHLVVVLVNGLKLSAVIFEPWSILKHWLVDSSTRKFDDLRLLLCGGLIFEIYITALCCNAIDGR